MKIEVIFTNKFDLSLYKKIIENSVCVVIDTLMAVSNLTSILNSNCKRIILAKNKNEAYRLKDFFNDYLLCGEEDGVPPKNFNYSNQPLNFLDVDLSNKKFIFSTTNGTSSFYKLEDGKIVFGLCFLNMDSAINKILNTANSQSLDILMVCSGRRESTAYEDIYTVGYAIKKMSLIEDFDLSESARVALDIYKFNNEKILDVLINSESGQIVRRLGYHKDLEFCSKLNVFHVIPQLKVIDLKNLNYNSEYKDIYDLVQGTNLTNEIFKLYLIEPSKF